MKLVIAEPLAVSGELLETLSSPLRGEGWDVEIFHDRPQDQQELGRRLASADAAVITNYPCREEALSCAEALKYLCIAFTGVDHADIDYCREHGIAVSNCAGYSTEAVAELVFGMAVSLLREIPDAERATRSGGSGSAFLGGELAGKRFGIIGTGAIGQRTAELARAFGCDVWGYNRTPKDEAIHYADLETVLRTSDIISIHLPLTSETKGIIGKKEIALMKKTAILINTARGPVLDAESLAEALREERIAGAGIDVYDTEPPLPADHPLLSAPHCILTPHIGFFSKEAMERRAGIVFDNIRAWAEGRQKNIIC